MPTAHQRIHAADGWSEVLRIAGIVPRDAALSIAGIGLPVSAQPEETDSADEGDGEEPGHVVQREQRRRLGMPTTDAVCWFVRLQGVLPTWEDLRWFGARHKIGIQRYDTASDDQRAQRWSAPLAEARARLHDDGVDPFPRLVPAADRRRETDAVLPKDVRDRYRRRGYAGDLDTCANAVLTFWDTLPVRQEPTQATYRRWATGRPYPAVHTFASHGGFTAVKERARALRQAGAAAR